MSAAQKTSRLMIAAGLVMAIGAQLHPHGSGDGVDQFILNMVESSTWNLAHISLCAGLLIGVASLVVARRAEVFGESARPWVTFAIVGWSFAAIELVPHMLAVTEADGLRDGGSTPLVDLHLMLQMLATPALGLSTASLAIAVARNAATPPAWLLAAVATVGGVTYAAAGPLINLTENVSLAPMFAAEAAVAVWLIGTALRLRSAATAGSPVSEVALTPAR